MPAWRDPIERFLEKFDQPAEGCWLWRAGIDAGGYGRFAASTTTLAHVFSYEHFVGPVPVGLEIDHLCGVRCCIRPDHLEPVTHAENVARGRLGQVTRNRQVAKTHCAHGHEYTDENLYLDPRGRRGCRTCRRLQGEAARKRNPERAREAARISMKRAYDKKKASHA